jgi:hypothetical protein
MDVTKAEDQDAVSSLFHKATQRATRILNQTLPTPFALAMLVIAAMTGYPDVVYHLLF